MTKTCVAENSVHISNRGIRTALLPLFMYVFLCVSEYSWKPFIWSITASDTSPLVTLRLRRTSIGPGTTPGLLGDQFCKARSITMKRLCSLYPIILSRYQGKARWCNPYAVHGLCEEAVSFEYVIDLFAMHKEVWAHRRRQLGRQKGMVIPQRLE